MVDSANRAQTTLFVENGSHWGCHARDVEWWPIDVGVTAALRDRRRIPLVDHEVPPSIPSSA